MSLELAETMVRMGELVISRAAGDVLACIGLGSCIGLALVSDGEPVAGLAHVVLPSSASSTASDHTPGKFGDTAVPALVDALVRAGATKRRLRAVLVGGAHMFAFRSGDDIGQRNEAAARAALEAAGIPVAAARTSGQVGRTIRVHVGSGLVTVKEAGVGEHDLLPGRSP